MPSQNRKKRRGVRARKLPLQQVDFSRSAIVSLCLAGALCGLSIFVPFWFPLPTMLGVLAFGVTVIVAGRRGRHRMVVVGVDGVLVHDRFVPHSRIEGVRHQWRVRDESDVSTGVSYKMDAWTLSLKLVGGEVFDVETGAYPRRAGAGDEPQARDDSGAEIARAIEEAHEAWTSVASAVDARNDVLARRDDTGSEWLRALRQRGSGAAATYRGVAVDLEHLSRTLGDVRARPSVRAAAAVVLGASGDTTAAKKLRIAVKSMADPRLRIALTDVAEGANDVAIAEALEALDEADRRKPGSEE